MLTTGVLMMGRLGTLCGIHGTDEHIAREMLVVSYSGKFQA